MARFDSILPGSTSVSHLKNPPASISVRLSITFGLALTLSSGCAMVQIPSYRLEECAAESYCSAPALMPRVPQIPMPGWFVRWKAEKDLPKPPESPRFHPLPTRPMFQPRPTTDFGFGAPGAAACYGTLPPAQSWNGVESVLAAPVPASASPF